MSVPPKRRWYEIHLLTGLDYEEAPKRRFWQIHLSTAMVLMFMASGFLWFDLTPRHVQWSVGRMRNTDQLEPATVIGWPIPHNIEFEAGRDYSSPSFVGSIVVNFGVMFVGLYIVAEFLECLIRRREARKP